MSLITPPIHISQTHECKEFVMKSKYKTFIALKKELESYEKQGAKITMSGEDVPAEFAAMLCAFCERKSYMRDYIFDDNGRVVEIGFNKTNY